MNGHACQYAIIRFLPYAETGEFANVGVVLACPETGYFGAQLMPGWRPRRISAFFDALDKRIFRETMSCLAAEVERMRQLLLDCGGMGHPKLAQQLFAELTRPREALLRCGETRVILAADPEETLGVLYARLVERDFADKAWHDRLLERGVRQILQRAQLRSLFNPAEIGDETLHVSLPFVHLRNGLPVRAIKPLDLAREQPGKVYDAGGLWVDRVGRLQRHGLLPAHVLFAVQLPDDGAVARAANEIVDDLRKLQVSVARADDAAAIMAFARPAARAA